MARFTTEFHN